MCSPFAQYRVPCGKSGEKSSVATMNLTERRKIYINYTLFCIDFAEVSKRPHKSTFVVYMFNELLLLHCIANMVGIHNSHHAYSDSDAKLCLACSKQQD